jgi:hypothetical protein
MEAKQGHEQMEQKQEIPRTEAAASQDKQPKGGTEPVEALVDLLQRTALEVRKRGVSCSILGKDGRVVAFQTKEETEDSKEGEEGTVSQLSMGSLVGLEECDVILKITLEKSVRRGALPFALPYLMMTSQPSAVAAGSSNSTIKYLPASSGMYVDGFEMYESIILFLIELQI